MVHELLPDRLLVDAVTVDAVASSNDTPDGPDSYTNLIHGSPNISTLSVCFLKPFKKAIRAGYEKSRSSPSCSGVCLRRRCLQCLARPATIVSRARIRSRRCIQREYFLMANENAKSKSNFAFKSLVIEYLRLKPSKCFRTCDDVSMACGWLLALS